MKCWSRRCKVSVTRSKSWISFFLAFIVLLVYKRQAFEETYKQHFKIRDHTKNGQFERLEYNDTQYFIPNVKPFDEFEDLGPQPDNYYAYVWYAWSNVHLCSALIALSRLQQIRKDFPEKPAVEPAHFQYVLLYPSDLYTPRENRRNKVGRSIIQKWKSMGGTVEKILSVSTSTKLGSAKVAVLEQAFGLSGYTWIAYMSPFTVPMRNLDHLFFLYRRQQMSSVNLVTGPDPDPLLEEFYTARGMKKKKCFGPPTDHISPVLLATQPSSFSKNLISECKDQQIHDDFECINYAHGCNDEIHVLNASYGVPDHAFLTDRQVKLEETLLFYFGSGIVPLDPIYKRLLFPSLPPDVQSFLNEWTADALHLCGTETLRGLNEGDPSVGLFLPSGNNKQFSYINFLRKKPNL